MEHVAADVRRLKLKGLKAQQTIAWGQAKQTPSWAIVQKISSPALFFLLLLQLPFGEFAVAGLGAFPNQLAVDSEDTIITVVRRIKEFDGVVAQLVERLVRNEKVRGSTPLGSTIL